MGTHVIIPTTNTVEVAGSAAFSSLPVTKLTDHFASWGEEER